MLQRAFQHGSDGIVGIVFFLFRRINAATVDADSDRAIVLRRLVNDKANFFLPGLTALVMVKVAGVVSNFIDVRRNQFGKLEILLQINRQIGRGLFANFCKSFCVLITVHSNTHDASASLAVRLGLSNCGVDILRFGGRHALNSDRISIPDGDGADDDGTSWVSRDLHLFWQ